MKPWMLKFIDATIGWFACWALGAARHWLRMNPDVPPVLAGKPLSRLLVIRPGGIGDMILLLPALQTLRRTFPGIIIDMICERRNREVLSLAGWPDAILQYDSPLRLIAHVRRHRYDAVIDTEQFHYFSALMSILARAPARIGFKISPGRNLLYTHLVNYALEGHEADQFMALLRPLDIGTPPALSPVLHPPPALPPPVAGWCGTPGMMLVTIHPGGTTACKQWAPERFAELLRRLARDSRLVFAILGDRRDRRLADSIAVRAALGDRLVSLAGRLTLTQTASILANASACIGGDSGIAHIAGALQTPTITLFGPSDSRKWGNASKGHVILQRQPACAPCCIFGYHKFCHSIACMAAITVDDVEAASRRLLEQGKPS